MLQETKDIVENNGTEVESVHLGRIQKLIAQRMSASKRNKPCYYMEAAVDTTELIATRPKLRKLLKVKVTTNSFYIHALAVAVAEFPLMAGKFDGENIHIADAVNVGFAVNAPHGLVVPVIKEADRKSLAEIAALENELTDKARSNTLTLEDMEAETVALSNLGVYGIDSFFGIVPPPASTILAVGNIERAVVWHEGRIDSRRVTVLTLAVDGRIVDEFYAARFLGYIKELLERPEMLIAGGQ
jgi:pyruvate dehydrogenase E2 component (dihydrolipoamide acetyltransferase)